VRADAELLPDVALDERRGRGGQCDHRRRPKHRHPLAEHPVVRTKVVTPLEMQWASSTATSAGARLASSSESPGRSAARSDEQKVQAPARYSAQTCRASGAGDRSGSGRREGLRRELGDLVLHEEINGLTTSVVPARAIPGSW